MLIPLKALIDELEEDKELNFLLSSFSCKQDTDIEHFLHNRAVEFEKLSKSRTYLILDEDELLSKDILNQTIYGYISLALKILSVPENISNRKRQELDGFSAKLYGEVIKDFPCYLIGQLARSSNVNANAIKGRQILELAESVIARAVNSVGGRYVMIECRDDIKLTKFYEDNDFEEIARIPDNGQPMVQMIKRIR